MRTRPFTEGNDKESQYLSQDIKTWSKMQKEISGNILGATEEDVLSAMITHEIQMSCGNLLFLCQFRRLVNIEQVRGHEIVPVLIRYRRRLFGFPNYRGYDFRFRGFRRSRTTAQWRGHIVSFVGVVDLQWWRLFLHWNTIFISLIILLRYGYGIKHKKVQYCTI